MIFIEWFGWIAFVLSIGGLYFNVKQDVRCFYIWSTTNVAWIAIDLHAAIYSQAAIMFVNLCFAIWGIFHWRRIKKHL